MAGLIDFVNSHIIAPDGWTTEQFSTSPEDHYIVFQNEKWMIVMTSWKEGMYEFVLFHMVRDWPQDGLDIRAAAAVADSLLPVMNLASAYADTSMSVKVEGLVCDVEVMARTFSRKMVPASLPSYLRQTPNPWVTRKNENWIICDTLDVNPQGDTHDTLRCITQFYFRYKIQP